MKGFLNRIWANHSIDKIIYVHKGVVLVCFAQFQDKVAVEKRGFYFFDSKPMLVAESLSKIGSILGIPIKTDKFTKDRQVIHYARLLVEMPIDGPFLNHIEFFNEDEPVTYEWILTKCSHCAMMGHTEDVCKKKGVIRTEWRKIQKSSTPCQPNSECTQVPQPTADPTNQLKNVGLVGLLETKIKSQNVNKIAGNIFRGWEWANNSSISNGRIWHATRKRFHITFISGHNHESQRQPLWEALHQISLSTHGAWCLLGDFNTILSKEDRYGGNHVEDHHIQELTNFMANCEVLEMPSSGAFFTWTNKTIWSKIDRLFINSIWHEVFDYTLATVLPRGLSDHSPILI
ncbi:hypothetical protein Cgig2_013875 [Carnegiea gigantea]|uniref:Endonuclease/exonuclease/phosphatase domain-containing protein n=1 Tax=Carnegiea gigantea TaxID=171969 RepID=A0A9Q1KHR3_9CARY|nr:hypothetical protein Cgig2_013875 [Carnegiea gigantea]